MATLIFRLRGAPEDEVRDVQTLLTDNGIDWYATDAGNWGISVPAIWIHHDDDHERARTLIERYQLERERRLRTDYRQQRAAGELPGLWRHVANHPLQSVAILLFSAGVLYLMVRPFIELALAPAGR